MNKGEREERKYELSKGGGRETMMALHSLTSFSSELKPRMLLNFFELPNMLYPLGEISNSATIGILV